MSLTWEEGREVGGREGCSRWEEVQQATLVWEEHAPLVWEEQEVCIALDIFSSHPIRYNVFGKVGTNVIEVFAIHLSATSQYVSQYFITQHTHVPNTELGGLASKFCVHVGFQIMFVSPARLFVLPLIQANHNNSADAAHSKFSDAFWSNNLVNTDDDDSASLYSGPL